MRLRSSIAAIALSSLAACSTSSTSSESGTDSTNEDKDSSTSTDSGVATESDSGSTIADAGATDSAVGDSSVASRKRVFVTSSTYTGDLKTAGAGTDGFDGANKLCNSVAANASLGGTWKAWLSSSLYSPPTAADRLGGTGPWYLVDRKTLVFAGKSSMISPPANPIDIDENGDVVIKGSVWTGTSSNGTAALAQSCAAWVNTGATALAGSTANVAEWTAASATASADCTNKYRLYCFED